MPEEIAPALEAVHTLPRSCATCPCSTKKAHSCPAQAAHRGYKQVTWGPAAHPGAFSKSWAGALRPPGLGLVPSAADCQQDGASPGLCAENGAPLLTSLHAELLPWCPEGLASLPIWAARVSGASAGATVHSGPQRLRRLRRAQGCCCGSTRPLGLQVMRSRGPGTRAACAYQYSVEERSQMRGSTRRRQVPSGAGRTAAPLARPALRTGACPDG